MQLAAFLAAETNERRLLSVVREACRLAPGTAQGFWTTAAIGARQCARDGIKDEVAGQVKLGASAGRFSAKGARGRGGVRG